MVINSKWAANPIALTDSLNDPSWADALPQKWPVAQNAWLYLKNDAHNMYLAIDMPTLTNSANSGDYFWLDFDVNRNGTINPNQDIEYGILNTNPGKIGKCFLLGQNVSTGIRSWPGTYVFDFEASPNNAVAHKVWKLKIPLVDFGIDLSALNFIAWMGLRVYSNGTLLEYPVNFEGAGFPAMNTSVMVFARNANIDPALMGPVMAAVGLIPTAASVIDPASGRATTAAGYYVSANKSAFGGMLNIIFNHNTVNGLRAAPLNAAKYKVMFGLSGGALSELQSAWSNYRWVGNDVVLDAFGPDGAGFYTLPNPLAQYSIEDLLIQFNSGLLANGLYQFTVQFFTAANAPVASPPQTLYLFIDNTVPVVAINKISRATAPGVDVLQHVCDPLTLGHTEGLVFDITATDPEGDISSYSMDWNVGDGGGGNIYNDAFGPSKPVVWTGVNNLIVPIGGTPWVPAKTCVYSFTLTAWSRTTNGYGSIGYNGVTKMLYIVKS